MYDFLKSNGAVVVLAVTFAACTSPGSERPPDADTGDVQTGSASQMRPTGAMSDLPTAMVYKSPTCGCCSEWVDHLEEHGFVVQTTDMPDVSPMRQRLGVPQDLTSCHTAVIGKYVVEGHVPASTIKRMLDEEPGITGIAVPGMPIGSPGMEVPGRVAQPYEIFAFDRQGGRSVFEAVAGG